MATSSLETALPNSYQGPPTSQEEQEQTNPLQSLSSLLPLAPQSLPIAIEMHDGNGNTTVNTGQRSFVIDNGSSGQRQRVQQEPKPENHLTLGFLSTLFCACPCGLMSLCHAIQVNSDYYHGNTVGAVYNSQQAWRWGLTSVVLGSLCLLIVIMYYLILMAIHIT